MIITDKMNLDQLAERMGDATESEALYMREALIGSGEWNTTEEISSEEWAKLCEAAIAKAEREET